MVVGVMLMFVNQKGGVVNLGSGKFRGAHTQPESGRWWAENLGGGGAGSEWPIPARVLWWFRYGLTIPTTVFPPSSSFEIFFFFGTLASCLDSILYPAR